MNKALVETGNVAAFWTGIEARLKTRKIPALDGTRALAVFLVIGYHFGFPLPGGHGVMAFFVLSGFLTTWLLLREDDRTGSVSLRNFYIRRALRIFPAFYGYWCLALIFLLVRKHAIIWPHAVTSFLYVSNYYNAIHGTVVDLFSHTWSLGIEEQFYLLWPGIFFLLKGAPGRMWKTVASVIVIVWIYRAVLVLVFGVSRSYIYNAFDCRLDHLGVGCLLAILIHGRVAGRLWMKLTSVWYAPAITLVLLVASVSLESRLPLSYQSAFGYIIDPLFIGVLLIQWICLSSHPLWKWLNYAWVVFLGQLSYSLYLYHQITVYPAKQFTAGAPVAVQFLCTVAVTIAVACGSFYVIERPFLRLKEHFAVDGDRPGAAARAGRTGPA